MENKENIFLVPAISVQHQWPLNMEDDDLGEFKNQAQYDTFNTWVKKVNNVWVSSDSVVYKNGLLIKETLALQDQASYYQLRYLAKKIVTGKKIRLDDTKKYLLVTDAWSTGHFHWFVDVLPKLLCMGNSTNEFILLLPDNPYIRNIGLESLELLQLSFGDIALMKETEFYKIKNLYYIPGISVSGHIHTGLIKTMQQKLIGERKPGNKKIYISRSKALFRKVVNEDDFTCMLKGYNYDILYGEDLSLKEQIDIFSSCNTLLGIHGAGLTNCIFMPPGKNVVELRKKENGPHNVGYWHLADSLDLKYYYYNGVPDSEKTFVGQGCNLTIPVNDFEEKIVKQIL